MEINIYDEIETKCYNALCESEYFLENDYWRKEAVEEIANYFDLSKEIVSVDIEI